MKDASASMADGVLGRLLSTRRGGLPADVGETPDCPRSIASLRFAHVAAKNSLLAVSGVPVVRISACANARAFTHARGRVHHYRFAGHAVLFVVISADLRRANAM